MNAPTADTMECAIGMDFWIGIQDRDKDYADECLMVAFGSLDPSNPICTFPSCMDFVDEVERRTKGASPLGDLPIQHLAAYPSKHDPRCHMFFRYHSVEKRYVLTTCYWMEGLKAITCGRLGAVWLVFEAWSKQLGLQHFDKDAACMVLRSIFRATQGKDQESLHRYAKMLGKKLCGSNFLK